MTAPSRQRPDLTASSQAYRVLLVCMGNICRSPMAEIVLRSKLSERALDSRVTVDSAGTGGWHAGDPADPRAEQALAGKGYPTSHTARQLPPEWFDQRDLVIALDRGNERDLRHAMPNGARAELRLLGEFDPEQESVDVDDPYYEGTDAFAAVLDQIERCCEGLVTHIQEHISAADVRQ